MGHTRHHAILVTTFLKEQIDMAHQTARDIFPTSVSEINASPTNCFYSFAVFPDGSKEGWEDSDKGDVNRKVFTDWLDSQRYEDSSTSLDWIEVQYGDDSGDTRIIGHSDEEKTEPIVVDSVSRIENR